MSKFQNYQYPMFNMGFVPEDGVPHAMPVVRVAGPWAGTPEGDALLDARAMDIVHKVTGLRQHYYTGIVPMVRRVIDRDDYRLEYVMNQGQEIVTLTPFPGRKASEELSDVERREAEEGGRPCRFILIEHTYTDDTVQRYTLNPDYDEVFKGGRPVVAEVDGHRLLGRHEIRNEPFVGRYVGTGLGTLAGLPNWEDYRATMPEYLNVFPKSYELYDIPESEWPPLWNHWRIRNTETLTYPTRASQSRFVATFGELPGIPVTEVENPVTGTFTAGKSANLITIVDTNRFDQLESSQVSITVTGFWDSLDVVWASPISGAYAPSKFWYDFTAGFVGAATPAEVRTTVTRVWLSSDTQFTNQGTDIERLMKWLDEAPETIDGALQPSKEFRDSLGIRIRSDAFSQIVTARQAGAAPPYPNEDGSWAASEYGYPPTVLPWGDELAVIRYNHRTGKYQVTAKYANRVSSTQTQQG